MRNLVTLSDINYINKGLILFDSLLNNTDEDFKLYYLCLDDYTYGILKNIDNNKLIPYHIDNIINDDEFKKLINSSKSLDDNTINLSSTFSTYHFASASYVTFHLMEKYKLPEIIYIDSDIKFYGDFNDIFKSIENKSIGLILHRHNNIGCFVGGYNVGIIYFKNDEPGYNCLKWWRDCMIDKDNPWSEKYGTCGDQKYLEAFGMLFGDDNIKILDDDIGHGAPWNFRLYQYQNNNNIIWEGKNQKILFNHFSHFDINYENNNYKIDKEGEWRSCLKPYFRGEIKKYYDDYFDDHIKIKIKYNL